MEIGSNRDNLKTILHLDMNSYFASVEQQANPYLQGRPVGIIKAEGRGCIIAASVEAKKSGVRTGSTVWEARKLCPAIILVPSDTDKYFSQTEKMIRIVSSYSPIVEVFSIDEVFADVTQTQKLFPGGIVEMVFRIKKDISMSLGEWVKCSVGVSFNKLAAKLGSEMNKPDGLTFLTKENYLTETETVNVKEVCGIGHSRSKLLYGRGIFNLGQARKADLPREISDLVWLRGSDSLVTNEVLERAKSVSRTYTTFANLETEEKVEKLIRNLVEEAVEKLRQMGMSGRTLCLFLRSDTGNFWTRKTLSSPTHDGYLLFRILWQEYKRNPLLPVRFAGVSLSNLALDIQPTVIPEIQKRETAMKYVDTINAKWGEFTVYPAILLGGELIRPEVTGFLGDKWYRFGGLERTRTSTPKGIRS